MAYGSRRTSRSMGIDYGHRRVGVAMSDGLGISAQPLEVVSAGPGLEARLVELVEEYEVVRVVIGLPLSFDGSDSAATKAVRRFADRIDALVDAEVVLYDERFTTRIAEAVLLEAGVSRAARKRRLDKMAAAVMLQGYLDRRARTAPQ